MKVFVGSRTTRERNARGVGVSVYEVDITFARWRLLQTLDLVNPSFLLADPGPRRLYAVHGDMGEISARSIDGAGKLEVLKPSSVEGRNPVHLEHSGDRRHILVASYATHSLSALPVLADGSLGAASSVLDLQGTPGPHRTEQRGSHPHHLPRWPGSNLFIVPDKGLDQVHVVRLGASGKLERVGSAAARSCSGPRHATFDLEQARIWVANELDSTVTAWAFDAATGGLRAERIVGLLPDEFVGESRAAGIVRAGSTLYVTNRGHDSVTVLHTDVQSGAVRRREWFATLGTTPRFLTLTPDKAFLLVANEGSDTIVRWRVRGDGSLEDGRVVAETGSPVCVAFLR